MELHPIARRLAARLADGAGEPVTRLIVDDLWLGVVDGTLEVGERLPTARELAVALRVSPRTVERAYAELERRGVIAVRPPDGVVVSLAESNEDPARRELVALCREALERAAELGFRPADLVQVLTDLAEQEGAERENPVREPST